MVLNKAIFVGGTLPKDLNLKLDRNYTNTTEHKIIKIDLAFIVTVIEVDYKEIP